MDSDSFWHLIGGIGLFLLGMSLMTDGLMQGGTRTVRRLMARVTSSRWVGLATGMGVTSIVQSSSATTLMTVSFVSAGVVSFQQSIAVMLGANIGTTSTAWIVSLVGFKMSSAFFALPAIGIGAMIRLISRGRRQALGLAIAGFGLVFLGIDFLQSGMASIAANLRPEDLGGDGLLGTLALVGVGVVMTVVMQSSSAAAVTTLAAVHAGSINFEQAAALVIGQNIGTTVTAIMGALGGNIAARRAAAAHVMFNVITGLIALVLLGPFTHLIAFIGDDLFGGAKEAEVALFHTAFNILGVALFLPLLGPFSRLVERLVPERQDHGTARLSRLTLTTPALAIEAARLTALGLGARAIQLATEALSHALPEKGASPTFAARAARLLLEPRRLLTGEGPEHVTRESRFASVQDGALRLRDFLGQVGHIERKSESYGDYLAVVYAADHIQRIIHGIRLEGRLQSLALDEALVPWVEALCEAVGPIYASLSARAAQEASAVRRDADEALAREIDALRVMLERQRVTYRASLLARTAAREVTTADTDELLDTNRWLVDLGHNASRVAELLVWPRSSSDELAEARSAPSASP